MRRAVKDIGERPLRDRGGFGERLRNARQAECASALHILGAKAGGADIIRPQRNRCGQLAAERREQKARRVATRTRMKPRAERRLLLLERLRGRSEEHTSELQSLMRT